MKAAIWTANILGWPILQLGIGSWMVRRPIHDFSAEGWLTRPRAWEAGSTVYRRLLALPRWKHLLPNGAPLLGGLPQKALLAHRRYNELLAETRRAELAHWYMLLCTPVFFLWNPWWAWLVMLGYAILSNVPCILNQRFTRIRLLRQPGIANVRS